MSNPDFDLPEEIWLEIFSRTPAKTVGRCRTLSKSWKSRLSTNSFIKKHVITRKQTIQQEHLALITFPPQFRLDIITSPTKSDEVFDEQSFRNGSWFNVLGSCNGLFLLTSISNMWMVVNPITFNQVTNISPGEIPRTKALGCVYSFTCGFGYDSCADDYKIVEIRSYTSKKTFVNVYSVKNGVWKMVDSCYPYDEFVPSRYGSEGGAFMSGALHWLICSKEGYRSCIAAFDLANEVFRETPLPRDFVRQLQNDGSGLARTRRSNGVSVVGESLLIVGNHGYGETDVWIMREYGVEDSWVKFRIQSKNGICKWDSIAATLCYLQDGELLCLTDNDSLFACNLKGGTVRKVVLGGCDAHIRGMAFVDSLVSPEGFSLKDGETFAKLRLRIL